MIYSYAGSPPQSFQYAVLPFDNTNAYDNLSDESSPGSPPGYEQVFPGIGALGYPVYPYAGPAAGYIVQSPTPPQSTDGEIDGELGCGDRRKRRASAVKDKDSLSQIHSRRRAQNRASQRAFRDRKEKHVKDLERRLDELESKHKTLEQSYSKLSTSHEALKKEMERLEAENDMLRTTEGSGGFGGMLDGQDFESVSLDGSLLYSGPTFYFDNELLDTHKEISPSQVDDSV